MIWCSVHVATQMRRIDERIRLARSARRRPANPAPDVPPGTPSGRRGERRQPQTGKT